MTSSIRRAPLVLLLLSVLGPGLARAVSLDFVPVGDPGNPGDTEVMRCCEELSGTTGYGSVPYVYQIGRYEVTVDQYTEFLNATAASDPNGLWDPLMGESKKDMIRRSGTAGSYSYVGAPGRGQHPIAAIQFHDAARFTNWLHNGQPVGPQDASTTEDGAYTLLGSNPSDVLRNDGARFFIPSQDEWYKAAYYDPLEGYFDYPTGQDVMPDPVPPPGEEGPAANFCAEDKLDRIPNCPSDARGPGEPTDVGAYVDSQSPWGTYDQGGNLLEWNEALVFDETAGQYERGFRGGWHDRGPLDLSSSIGDHLFPSTTGLGGMGFRVASVPEPGTGVLLGLGLAAFAGGARLGRRRENAERLD